MRKPVFHLVQFERVEAEPCAPALDSWDDLVHVVADDAEAHVLCVLLDDCIYATTIGWAGE